MLTAGVAEIRTMPVRFHRLTRVEGEDTLTIDLLIKNEERRREIIKTAIAEETEYGLTCIALPDTKTGIGAA